jgi:hypothetical protein
MSDKSKAGEDVGEDAKDTTIPHYYINGFSMGLSNSDVLLTLKMNNTNIATINMSLTTCKTVAEKLTRAIEQLERLSERSFLTMNELKLALKEFKIDEPL